MPVRIRPRDLKSNKMEVVKLVTEKIEWDIDLCKADAVIEMENGRLLNHKISIRKTVVGDNDLGNLFISDDLTFIRDVHKALGDFICHIDGSTEASQLPDDVEHDGMKAQRLLMGVNGD